MGWLLSYGMSWGQDQAIFLSDMAFVFGAGEARTYLREEMQAFSDQHHVRLAFTLLPESSPPMKSMPAAWMKATYSNSLPLAWLSLPGTARTNTTRRHQVQINDALAQRLPPATAEQIVNEWLTYYDNLPPQSGMQMGFELVIRKLGDYLQALPPPEVVPTITFANEEAVGSRPPLGLDAFTYEVHRSQYDQETVNEEPYPVAWKALLSGQTTSVLAQIDEGVSFPPGLAFKQNGNAIATQPATENHQQQLTLTGQMNEQEGDVEVYASSEENAELVGKLRTISYDALYQKLVLVVLDDVMDDAPYLARLSRELPAILAQAGVSLTVESQELDTEWGDRDVPLEDETSGLLSNYPDQLKRVIKDYRKEHEEEKETAYIFLAGSSRTGKLGYMPKKRAYGFVYLHEHDNEEPVEKTIAHELGHGLFRLEHTFEAYPALTKGSTNNLMDYGRGTRLHKYQWDLVHNPEAMLGWFQDEEESASYDCPRWFSKDEDCESVGKVLRMTKKASANGMELITYGSTWKREIEALDIDLEGVRFSKIKVINMVDEGKNVSYFTKDYQDFRQSYLNAEGETEKLEGFILQTASTVSSEGKLLASVPAVKILLYEDAAIFEERKEFLRTYLFGEASNEITIPVPEVSMKKEERPKKEEKPQPKKSEEIEAILSHATTATVVGDKFTKATACNICVRSALYLIKGDSALFPMDGSGYHDPNNNYESREIKGYITPNGNAKRIKGDFDNLPGNPTLNERFVEVKKTDKETWQEYFKRLQDQADIGKILVGVMLNSSGSSGHIMMVMPGGLIEISRDEPMYGEYFFDKGIKKLPRVLECGNQNRDTKAPLCRQVDRRGAQERLKWFKYTK